MVVVPEGSYGRLWEDTPTSWWTGFHVDDTPGYGPPITSSRITVTDYYRFRSTQLSLDDYRAVDRSGLGLLFFRLRKLFGLDGPNLYWSDPSLLEVIDPGDIDNAAVTTAISTAAAEAQREGLQLMLWYRIPQLLPGVSAGAMFLSPCRRFTATAAAAKLATQPAQPLAAGFGCASQRPGGAVIGTTNMSQIVPTAPRIAVERRVGGTLADVVALHRQRLDGTEVLQDPGTDALLAGFRAEARIQTDFLRARGILQPFPDDKVAAIRRQHARG